MMCWAGGGRDGHTSSANKMVCFPCDAGLPGALMMRGTLVASSKLVCLWKSLCSPSLKVHPVRVYYYHRKREKEAWQPGVCGLAQSHSGQHEKPHCQPWSP
jgi:hypothetical protein